MNSKDDQIKTLTDRNEDLENYFSNTIIPQLFIDADLVLRKFTPPAMRQFKLTEDDIGKSIHDAISYLRFPSIADNILYVINSAEILEKEIQTTDLRWYQMNILPYVKKRDNKTNGVIMTFIDITERIKDLKEQEKLIADHEMLLDSIAHDIKNPLTSLLLSVELLNDGLTENPHQLKPLLKAIKSGVMGLHSIVKDLTESRDNRHKYKAIPELLNFENIIEDVRVTLLENIKDSGASITSEIQVSEIFFPRRKLRSIIYNLVNNGIKFRSPHRTPEILITTKREGDFIILTVEDNGIGIDAHQQESVFLKYFRVNHDLEGSGMGLHLVRELVTQAGGKVLIQSQLGKGTKFTVYLKAG